VVLIDVPRQRLLETHHQGGVLMSGSGGILRPGGQAMDDGVKQFLLQRSCDLWAFDQFLSGFCKTEGVS
jgi:hypothetical protein